MWCYDYISQLSVAIENCAGIDTFLSKQKMSFSGIQIPYGQKNLPRFFTFLRMMQLSKNWILKNVNQIYPVNLDPIYLFVPLKNSKEINLIEWKNMKEFLLKF